MKKKVKLFTTIASLCLAVALMAFGVYAAETATATINGSVTFTASAHVNATVKVTSTKSNFTSTKLKEVTDQVVYDTTANLAEASNASGQFDLGTADDLVPTAVGTDMVYTYTVTVINKAKTTDSFPVLNVSVVAFGSVDHAGRTVAVDGYSLSITNNIAGGKIAANASNDASSTIVVKLTIDSTRSMTAKDIGLVLTLTATAD